MMNVNDVIRRLQDVMADGNDILKESIGGVVDLETMLEMTSMKPISFHVSYGGSTPVEQNVLIGASDVTLSDIFVIYVCIDVKHLNARSAQAMIPTIKQNLMISLFGWEYGDNYPFSYGGDSVEYNDAGQYVHSFTFATTYRIENDEMIDSLITPFDSFYADIMVGENIVKATALNLYNDGDPL